MATCSDWIDELRQQARTDVDLFRARRGLPFWVWHDPKPMTVEEFIAHQATIKKSSRGTAWQTPCSNPDCKHVRAAHGSSKLGCRIPGCSCPAYVKLPKVIKPPSNRGRPRAKV